MKVSRAGEYCLTPFCINPLKLYCIRCHTVEPGNDFKHLQNRIGLNLKENDQQKCDRYCIIVYIIVMLCLGMLWLAMEYMQ